MSMMDTLKAGPAPLTLWRRLQEVRGGQLHQEGSEPLGALDHRLRGRRFHGSHRDELDDEPRVQ
jgi:hypothetical protein